MFFGLLIFVFFGIPFVFFAEGFRARLSVLVFFCVSVSDHHGDVAPFVVYIRNYSP